MPNLTHKDIVWNDETIDDYKNYVFDLIEKMPAMENFRNHIVFEKIYTPSDFEQRFHAYNGATFGLAPTLLQSNYFRPQNKSRKRPTRSINFNSLISIKPP